MRWLSLSAMAMAMVSLSLRCKCRAVRGQQAASMLPRYIVRIMQRCGPNLRHAACKPAVIKAVAHGSRLPPPLPLQVRILDTLREILEVDWKERVVRTVNKVMRSGALAVPV